MEPDPEDFTTLYKRSYRTILRYIYQRVNDHALAEDLTAETYARALEKQKNGVTITVGWLIRAARNLIGNEYQRRDRAQARMQRIVIEELTAAARNENEDDLEVRAAMARLRPADALVLQLTYWDGLSASEAATFLDCSTGAVLVRLTRARAKIRSMLMEESHMSISPRLVEGGDLDG